MAKQHWTDDQLAEIVKGAETLGLNCKEAADHFNIPVWRIYQYNHKKNHQRYQLNTPSTESENCKSGQLCHEIKQMQQACLCGQVNTAKETTNPDISVSSTTEKSSLPQEVKQIIISYKHQDPDCGFKKIEQHLRNKYFLVIPRKQIRHVLKEAGLLQRHDSSFDRDTAAVGACRFEAAQPLELYQMDITYVYIECYKVLYLIDIIDDHSRFCLRSVLRSDQGSDTLIEVLHDAIIEYGKPNKLLTDQGRAFYSWSTEKTKFQQYLDDMHIEHIVSDPHHPTTTGKVERFQQTIKNELIRRVKFKDYTDAVAKIDGFVHHYNYERPHQGLGGARPADRFMGVAACKRQLQSRLLDNRLHLNQGYLIFKYGADEISIVARAEQAPEIFVNGILYIARTGGSQQQPICGGQS